MNLVEGRKKLLLNALAGNATMLSSPSGYGKSSMVYGSSDSFVEDFRKRVAPRTVGVGLIFAATQTPPDLMGIMWKGERTVTLPDGTLKTYTVTDPSVPLWAMDYQTGKPYWMYDLFISIIEEYGQGEPDVKRGAAEILLNGGVGSFRLPAGSPRVGLTNKGARYGVTKDWLFAIARRTQIEITPDIDATVNYLDKPYKYQGRQWLTLPVTKSWAKINHQIVFEAEPKEDGPWCSPRTMCSVDRYVQVVEEVEGRFNPEDSSHMEVLAGTFGMPATQSFLNHMRFRAELPSYEEVVGDPEGVLVPTRADLRMMMVYELAGATKPKHLPQVLMYLSRLPMDMRVTYVLALLRRDYKSIINQPAMQQWIGQHEGVVNIISSLANG